MPPKNSEIIRDAINLAIQGDLAVGQDRPVLVYLSDRAMEALSRLFRDYRMHKRNEAMPEEDEP